MSGILLLDEEQQRTLYGDSQRSSGAERAPPSRFHVDTSNFYRAGVPRTDFTTPPEPRTDFTNSNPREPRTDFTNASRSDFISRPSPRNDFAANQGLPRTDFTTRPVARNSDHSDRQGNVSAGKPSHHTQRSSAAPTATVDFTMSGREPSLALEDADSYPILRDDYQRESSTGSSSAEAPPQYAGTSSGLKISVRWIMLGLVVGIVLGLFLSEVTVSSIAARWISLPGELFLRLLKCLVVPYVFCSVVVAVGDIVFVGKVSVVGLQTAKIYLLFWLSTVVLGIAVALIFRPFFSDANNADMQTINKIGFMCPNQLYATQSSNGTITCSTKASTLANSTTFVVRDLNSFYSTSSNAVARLSLSDQLMQMITPIVSKNIIASMANSELLSIITFSMVFGAIAGRNYFTKSRRVNYVYLTMLQLRNTLFLMMEWTIWVSPIAVVSIIAGSFAANPKFFTIFGDVYPYLLAALSATLLQALVVYPLIVFLTTRTNPYRHMMEMVRAYTFAFACASSLATMPVTLSCVKSAKMCSQSVANFVISIGVVSSISGMGFYLPIALVFLAESSGNGDQITFLRIVGIFVLSLLACAGTPPIPASGLVVISTAYTTLFGELPATAFAYVAALDFFFDRLTTTCNVNDDIMALKIISETTDETVAQDHLGERF